MATFAASSPNVWTPGYNQFGCLCWRNDCTGVIDHNPFNTTCSAQWLGAAENPIAAPAAAPMTFISSNVPTRPYFTPAKAWEAAAFRREAEAAAWKEELDKNTNTTYWHNTMTREVKWDKPKTETSPPPPPPRSPERDKRPEKEADQWTVEKDSKGKRFFYNNKTGEPQYERPDCLRKYR